MLDVTGAREGAAALAARNPFVRARAWLGDRSASGVAQRFAGYAYVLRVANAGITFLTQILLARWMGAQDFGIYVYVWTWVVLLGTLTNVGFASSSQRFIPTYSERGEMDLLRGFIAGGRWMAVAIATGFAGLGGFGLWLFADRLDGWMAVPLYLGLACLPLFVLTEVQEGVARSYNWPQVAMAPTYLVRPLLLMLILAGLHFAGVEADATAAMAAALAATWLTALAQMLMLNRLLARKVPAGRRVYQPGAWLRASFPQFMVEGFYLSLTYCDVIVLERFVDPDQVAVYYAATKLVALVAFVYFAVAAAAAHKFTEYHVSGRDDELRRFMQASIRWTFLPSLAMSLVILALGQPLLWLFGPGFTEGYALLPILLLGLLARASIGPVEKLMSMLGHQGWCAAIYALAFAANIGLNIVLVPSLGLFGAAIATTAAMAGETVLLFLVARRSLGLHVFYWGGSGASSAAAAPTGPQRGSGRADPRVEWLPAEAVAGLAPAWHDLAARAAEPNAFCTPAFVEASLRHLRDAAGGGVAAVWQADEDGAKYLIGIMPVLPRHRRWSGPLGVAAAMTHNYAPLGTPLLDADQAREAAGALLGWLRTGPLRRRRLMLPFLPTRGPTAAAFASAARERRLPVRAFGGFSRALVHGEHPPEPLLARLSAKRRRKVHRQERDLAALGAVTRAVADDEAGVAAALEDFLALELSGWKGQEARTATLQRTDRAAFVRAAVLGMARDGQVRIHTLALDGRAIAIGIVFLAPQGVAEGRALFWKIAYDEAHARVSPGVQLALAVTDATLALPGIGSIDSLADPGHPMIDHLWRERLEIADWLIDLKPGGSLLFPLACAGETLHRSARHRAKALLRRNR